MSDVHSSTGLAGDSSHDRTPSQDQGLFRPSPPQDRARQDVADPNTPDAESPPVVTRRRRERVVDVVRTVVWNWPIVLVLAAFSASAVVVPTMTDIATTDDWGYSLSVEMLVQEGTLKVFEVVAATAVGQVLWGAMFALTFGVSLGVMRLSTVVMVALGGIALYTLLRMLGVSRSRSALGMGVWIFNPLTFSLAFTFMTDAHFASVMLISLAFYVKGLRPGSENLKLVLVGSFFAGFAFLIRQQGALIPLSIGLYLLATGNIWFRWAAIRRIAAVAVIPAVMLVCYYIWLRWFNDVPNVQQDFVAEIERKGWEGTFLLIRRIPVYVLFYAGLLTLPLWLGIAPRWKGQPRAPLFRSPITIGVFVVWVTVVVSALYFAGLRGHEMPFAPQFVGPGGFGPPDVVGSRERLVERGSEIPIALTVLAAIGAMFMAFLISRRLLSEKTPERAGFWLLATVGFWQFVGIFPPSYHYTNRGVTLDRYMLPVIAVAIVATLWALRDVRIFQPIAWLALAGVAVFSTAAERDYLVFMDAIWEMADYANDNGIADVRLDAGSGWDGYHLYRVMIEEDVKEARSPRGSPWWVYFYAKPTDSSYIVSTKPDAKAGYVRVEQRAYDQWLEDETVHVYLLKRWYLPFPMNDPADNPTNRETESRKTDPESRPPDRQTPSLPNPGLPG